MVGFHDALHTTRDATQFRDAWAPHTQTQRHGVLAMMIRPYLICSLGISDPRLSTRSVVACSSSAPRMVLSRLRLVPLPTAARCMLRSRLPLQAMRTPTLHAPRRSRCSRASTAEAEVEAGWSTDLSWIVDMLQFGAFVAMVNHFALSMTQCIGPSMKPTLTSGGDIVLLWPLPMARLLRGGPQLGDVVIATSPSDPSQSVCKRVVGMPGDVVCVPPAPWASGRGERKVDVPRGEAARRSNPRAAHPCRFAGLTLPWPKPSAGP